MGNKNNDRGSNLKKSPLQSREINRRHRLQWRWLMQLESLALSRFKWNNLPDSVDERFLERTLVIEGQAVFFTLGGKLRATKVQLGGAYDMYFNPTDYTAIGDNNNFRYKIPEGEGVVAWDSMTRKRKYDALYEWSNELAEIDELIRVNRLQQRNMVILSGPEEKQSDLSALARDLQMNESTRITIGNLNDHGMEIKAINTGIEYKQDAFHADRTSTLNLIYSYLGIEHIPFEKSERLVSGEASIASDMVARMREDSLVPRQQAADKVNDLFGTDISVEWRRDEAEEMIIQEIDPTSTEGDKNE